MHSALRSLPGRVEKGLDRCVVTLSTTYTTQTEMDGGGEVRENEMEGTRRGDTKSPLGRENTLLGYSILCDPLSSSHFSSFSIMNDRSLVFSRHSCDSPFRIISIIFSIICTKEIRCGKVSFFFFFLDNCHVWIF